MFPTALRDSFLAWFNGDAVGAQNLFVGLLASITSWRAGTATETTYTGYTGAIRPGIATGLDAAENTTPAGGRQRKNTNALTFPQNTGSSVEVIGWGLYTTNTAGGGTLSAMGLLDADPPIFGVVTDVELAGNTIRCPDHELQADQRVFALAAPGAVMPAGISEDTAYFVGTAVDNDTLSLSTTVSNGNPVDITAAGGVLLIPYKAVTIANNATPEFAAGALIIQM